MKWTEPKTLTILHVEVLRRVIFGSENLYDAIEELEKSIEVKLLNAQKDWLPFDIYNFILNT